ncbi:MAG: MFS transporter [Actinomycetota bacterium]|nr:MFS transporter [Actinomycetota bacterium]
MLARVHLDLDPSGYGLLLGAIGIGAVLGPFLLTRLVSDPRRPLFVFGPYVLRGVVDIALAIFTALPVALVVYGLGTSTGAATFNSLLQAHVPEHARGRIFASFERTGSASSLLPTTHRLPPYSRPASSSWPSPLPNPRIPSLADRWAWSWWPSTRRLPGRLPPAAASSALTATLLPP